MCLQLTYLMVCLGRNARVDSLPLLYPVTKGFQVQLALLLRSQVAHFKIASSDCMRRGNVHVQGGQGSKLFPYLHCECMNNRSK